MSKLKNASVRKRTRTRNATRSSSSTKKKTRTRTLTRPLRLATLAARVRDCADDALALHLPISAAALLARAATIATVARIESSEASK
jgi:hypothetical protein